jgi:hypothetical protein
MLRGMKLQPNFSHIFYFDFTTITWESAGPLPKTTMVVSWIFADARAG